MKPIKTFTDQRLNSWCIHCNCGLGEKLTNRDHIPSKTLLREPYPENLPVIEICQECNSSFSADEEYVCLLIESVIIGTTSDDFKHNPRVRRAFDRNPSLLRSINNCRYEYETMGGKKAVVWKPDWKRINNIVVKNSRGHAYFEIGEPMLGEPTHVIANLLQILTDFELGKFEDPLAQTDGLWPEVGSRMMTRLLTGEDLTPDGWIIVQDGVYRYSVIQTPNGIEVRTVILEYLATHVTWSY